MPASGAGLTSEQILGALADLLAGAAGAAGPPQKERKQRGNRVSSVETPIKKPRHDKLGESTMSTKPPIARGEPKGERHDGKGKPARDVHGAVAACLRVLMCDIEEGDLATFGSGNKASKEYVSALLKNAQGVLKDRGADAAQKLELTTGAKQLECIHRVLVASGRLGTDSLEFADVFEDQIRVLNAPPAAPSPFPPFLHRLAYRARQLDALVTGREFWASLESARLRNNGFALEGMLQAREQIIAKKIEKVTDGNMSLEEAVIRLQALFDFNSATLRSEFPSVLFMEVEAALRVVAAAGVRDVDVDALCSPLQVVCADTTIARSLRCKPAGRRIVDVVESRFNEAQAQRMRAAQLHRKQKVLLDFVHVENSALRNPPMHRKALLILQHELAGIKSLAAQMPGVEVFSQELLRGADRLATVWWEQMVSALASTACADQIRISVDWHDIADALRGVDMSIGDSCVAASARFRILEFFMHSVSVLADCKDLETCAKILDMDLSDELQVLEDTMASCTLEKLSRICSKEGDLVRRVLDVVSSTCGKETKALRATVDYILGEKMQTVPQLRRAWSVGGVALEWSLPHAAYSPAMCAASRVGDTRFMRQLSLFSAFVDLARSITNLTSATEHYPTVATTRRAISASLSHKAFEQQVTAIEGEGSAGNGPTLGALLAGEPACTKHRIICLDKRLSESACTALLEKSRSAFTEMGGKWGDALKARAAAVEKACPPDWRSEEDKIATSSDLRARLVENASWADLEEGVPLLASALKTIRSGLSQCSVLQVCPEILKAAGDAYALGKRTIAFTFMAERLDNDILPKKGKHRRKALDRLLHALREKDVRLGPALHESFEKVCPRGLIADGVKK